MRSAFADFAADFAASLALFFPAFLSAFMSFLSWREAARLAFFEASCSSFVCLLTCLSIFFDFFSSLRACLFALLFAIVERMILLPVTALMIERISEMARMPEAPNATALSTGEESVATDTAASITLSETSFTLFLVLSIAFCPSSSSSLVFLISSIAGIAIFARTTTKAISTRIRQMNRT